MFINKMVEQQQNCKICTNNFKRFNMWVGLWFDLAVVNEAWLDVYEWQKINSK